MGNVARLALSLGAAALAGCSGSQSPIGAPGAMPQSRAIVTNAEPGGSPLTSHAYRVLYRFQDLADGDVPGALTSVNGLLYGATDSGGSGCSPNGCGTIFSITKSGEKKLLYSFKGGTDGQGPGNLTDVNGTLFGTTAIGGNEGCYSYGCGTVFKVTTSGKEQVLYRFTGGSDGWSPSGPLLLLNNELYGETGGGGNATCRDGCGTIFKVSTSGKEGVLYRFNGGNDGAKPVSGLLPVKGVLYGITSTGGVSCDVYSSGCGTVFKITTSGHETVLYRFKGAGLSDGSEDGGDPSGSLAELNGVLYGTTTYGGDCCAYSETLGTVYSITTSGKEHVIYRFNDGTGDGHWPFSGLIAVNGILYGSTLEGGPNKCWTIKCGVIFSVSKSGKEQILYDFRGPKHADGAEGSSALTYLDGVLYGASPFGGAGSCSPSETGCGTVFRISP